MAKLNGRSAAGLMQQAPEQVEMGLPPLWSVYLTVDDADDTVAKVEASGGSVMAPAFDVMDAGRRSRRWHVLRHRAREPVAVAGPAGLRTFRETSSS
jgi:predicted enzyme related to lactoylglutathione lyase